MRPSWRVTFLIMAELAVHNIALWKATVVLIGYWSFERLDQWLSKRAKEKVIDDETDGWRTDPDNPEYEDNGQLTRVKLSDKEQIMVTRVAELLRRIP